MPFGLDDLAFATLASGALSAGSGLLGGMFGRQGQAEANQQQMQFNSYQAQLNREWQERMSSTAYVRAMTDMRNAGLNPILAANLGGASTPGGATASASLGNPGAFMQQGITSAGDAINRAATTKAVLTQAGKDSSQTDLNKASTDFTKAQEGYTKSNTELNDKLKDKTIQDTATSAANAAAAAASANASNARAGLDAANTVNAVVQRGILESDAITARQRAADYVRHGPPGPVTNVTIPASRVTDRVRQEIENTQPQSSSGTAKFPPFTGLRNSPNENPSTQPGSTFWGTSSEVLERARRNRERYGN